MNTIIIGIHCNQNTFTISCFFTLSQAIKSKRGQTRDHMPRLKPRYSGQRNYSNQAIFSHIFAFRTITTNCKSPLAVSTNNSFYKPHFKRDTILF